MRALSISKLEPDIINEDAASVTSNYIAVSDGAGGGGLFADRWSRYLVSKLPEIPIYDFQGLDKWIDGIWEPFYNECEELAKVEGGLFLKKFYDEGSFATLVAVWKNGRWISFGDSVAFCYDYKTGILQHTFGRLSEFNEPPYLLNCKDPSNEKGFKGGQFNINKDTIVFAASDTLAHYILMMYEVSKRTEFRQELQEAIAAKTKNSNYINVAIGIENVEFQKDVLGKLLKCKRPFLFRRLICNIKSKGLIGHDDYSFVAM